MAYSSTNPPDMMFERIGGSRTAWMYSSTHVSTDVSATGFFTDGEIRGMREHDLIFSIVETTDHIVAIGTVVTVSTAVTVRFGIASS